MNTISQLTILLIMKNKLKKWPRNWVEHVTETCFFYFEDKGIAFVDSKILCSNKTENAKIYGMILTFTKDENIYDIFINYECSNFIINYYYKNYYRIIKRKETEDNFIFMMGSLLKGSDQTGLFRYLDLGGQASRDNITTAYNIIESIEQTINYHNGRNDEDNDDDGENGPIEPFSPIDVVEPEFLLC